MFEILKPGDGDCNQMAEIHVKAMHSNPLLHAQFPTKESIRHLQTFLERQYGFVRSSPTRQALAAKHIASGRIVGFASWETAAHDGDQKTGKIEDGELKDHKGCRKEYLEQYAALAATAEKDVMRGEACYHLSFVCVHPDYQRQGAGMLLTESVLNLAQDNSVPVYLESTTAAVPMYERLGFTSVGGFEMEIPQRDNDVLTEKYHEVCMLWRPVPKNPQSPTEKAAR